MRKPVKSQWEFGELFAAAAAPAPAAAVATAVAPVPPPPPVAVRKVLSVGELTTEIKRLLESRVGSVWVGGEITNLRAQSSGHMYFTLKDAGAQLSCVLFRGAPVAQRQLLTDGQKVLLQGEVTIYEARGQYQLLVRAVEMQGIGALQAAFERLKQKLAAEGLFAPERKRPLPRFPQRIGLVTSPTGAAIRDVLHVIQRRHPGLEIMLAPCRVQGDGAAAEIAQAIQLLNEFSQSAIGHRPSAIDLILVTRGGGSLEDLWAFNEEVVARAIFESALPVVSGVGHEIDFSIADFVADVRAATPSVAAELITEGVFASREFIWEAPARLRRLARRKLERSVADFATQAARLARMHPRRRLDASLQRLDDLQSSLLRLLKQSARVRGQELQHLLGRFLRAKPSLRLAVRREALRQLEKRLGALGPEQVLARGYSITTDAATGRVLRDAAEITPGQAVHTRLARGAFRSRSDTPPE